MDTVVHAGPKPRKRRRTLRIILIALAVAAVAEPVFMYRRLSREREERRAAAERSLFAPSATEESVEEAR